MKESIRKSDILIEALPYIQAFRGKVVVAKYGGSALTHEAAMRGMLQDLIFLSAVGIRPVLVHGGGPEITHRLKAAGQDSRFIDGMRVTDRGAIREIDRALNEVNRRLVAQIKSLGGHAEGIVARKGVVLAEPHVRADELGFVGTVKEIHPGPIRDIFMDHAIPVVSPIGAGNARLYNINADHVASRVAVRLKAVKFVLLTNVQGILRHGDDASSLISHVTAKDARRLMRQGVIRGGMIPKVTACLDALRQGVKKTHIIDASIPRAMLLEIFTKQGIGTEIVR